MGANHVLGALDELEFPGMRKQLEAVLSGMFICKLYLLLRLQTRSTRKKGSQKTGQKIKIWPRTRWLISEQLWFLILSFQYIYHVQPLEVNLLMHSLVNLFVTTALLLAPQYHVPHYTNYQNRCDNDYSNNPAREAVRWTNSQVPGKIGDTVRFNVRCLLRTRQALVARCIEGAPTTAIS